MTRTLILLVAALGLSSCLSPSVDDHRVAASEGTARHPGHPPARLTVGREMTIPSLSALGQRHVSVAYGDGVYLLAWQEGFDGAGGKADVLALRIAPDGKALDKEPIVVSGQPAGSGGRVASRQGPPSVAFCAGRFLVTWAPRQAGGTNGLYAVRTRAVRADGTLDKNPRDLSGNRLMINPAIAANGKDQFLLVWQEYWDDHFEVRGARIAAATGDWLDSPSLSVMTRDEALGIEWATGGRLAVAWTGSGYLVCQSVFATFLGPDGKTLLPTTRTWSNWSPGGYAAASAWGKGFVFTCVRPYSDPWGWGGNGHVVGMTVTAAGARYEREALTAMVPRSDKNLEFFLLADGFVPNCLDASRWLNHPGWPMGMPGGLKHAAGDVWPSGTPAAAHNGESLLVVWPRGHMVDYKRMRNRDLYLTRVLPDWSPVDYPAVPVSTGPTEEANPVLCAGPKGQTLLAYEKLTDTGVKLACRLIAETPDTTPPAVAYVVPKSRTEMVVAFDEPVEEASASLVAHFRIDGLAVKEARFNPDGRARRREVLLTTDPPVVGRRYALHVNGVQDRSPAGNALKNRTFAFLAKPGTMQRSDSVGRWAVEDYAATIPNPSLTGSRDFICRWNLLGPLPRSPDRHPFAPATIFPSPGDELQTPAGIVRWKVVENEAIDLGGLFGEKGNTMIYAATYVYADGRRRAMLRLDSNDHNRAWLNGRLVHDGISRAVGARGFHDYTDEIPVALENGWNRLLVQVENREGTWLMVGQITDEASQPIRDLTWTLERPQGLGGPAVPPAAGTPAAPENAAAPVPDAPVNQWVLLTEQAPTCVAENEIAWDSGARRMIWDGGHLARLYPQSNYTFLYDPVEDRFTESHAAVRPERRCQSHMAYLELERRTIVTDGGAGHGTIPSGGVGGDYRRVFYADPRGPWLYDSAADNWEDCRTLPPLWLRAKHAPVCYEPGSDAVFGLRGTNLCIYLPRSNRVILRSLPPELWQGRLSHGLAADPLHRKLVVFGGGGGFAWVKPKAGQTVLEARREAYERMAKNDTWVYDIVADRWSLCESKIRPPRGMPMDFELRGQLRWHDPSGTILLAQSGVDAYVPDRLSWDPLGLWSFDVATGQWTRVPLAAAGRRPGSAGLTAYARELDLFLLAGGHYGEPEAGNPNPRLTSGRQVWSCRVQVPGRKTAPVPPPRRITVTTTPEGPLVEWSAAAGEEFDVFRAVAEPLPGAYELLTRAPAKGGLFLDRTAAPGRVYAYAVALKGSEQRSLPACNQPWRPSGLLASVESANKVILRWKANQERDLAGYLVYRAKGGEVEKGSGRLLNAALVTEPRFTDTLVDLSDEVICSYWVTAVNRAGIESGAAPIAYTAPDAPTDLSTPEGVGPQGGMGERLTYVVSWRWPRDVQVAGFNVYGAVEVPDGSSPELRRKTWTKLTEAPLAAREFIYADPKEGTPCRYSYVRAVNMLGQEGFCTDIVSPTDRRFRQ